MTDKNPKQGKVSSFKKFSDLDRSAKIKTDDEGHDQVPAEEFVTKPNLPRESRKREVPADTKHLKPKQVKDTEDNNSTNESQVQFFGKLARLPKNTKASKGFNFLENVKISKSSIWYIMVEKHDNELQMIKYNHKKGVDLVKFVTDLKEYYASKYSTNDKVLEMIQNIFIDGNDKYSRICNIPLVEVDGKKMISKMTEDLIKLLSK
jgi:Fe-S-cluster formation regulator IscX/YfhJ